MEYLPKTKKPSLVADFTLDRTGGRGGGHIKQNNNDWKFQSYKGTNLGHGRICESVSDNKQ